MQQIALHNVYFHYDNPYTQVFEDASLALNTSWRTALVGPNGRGKTTLLQLLMGTLQPVRGTVSMPVQTSYFPFPVHTPNAPALDVILDAVAPFRQWERAMEKLLDNGDEPSLLEYGNILEQYEKRGGYDIEVRCKREIASIGMDTDILQRNFATLSGGEQTRALIVALFLRSDSFPLIDEPTNHLDREGRELIGAYLARKPGFLLVSHDRTVLESCADHIVALHKNGIRVTNGSFSQWQEQVAREEEHEQRRTANLQREIHALQQAARQRRTWAHAKENSHQEAKAMYGKVDRGFVNKRAADHMKRAIAVEQRVEKKLAEKQSLLTNVEQARSLVLPTAADAPDIVLSVENATVYMGNRTVLSNVSLRVHRGERIAVLGRNGCGKTTLLRAALGELPLRSGITYIPPYLHTARSYQRPLWQRGYVREHLQQNNIDETHFRTIMGCFGIAGAVFDRPLETFSFGERKKVDLCRSFVEPSHLLVWDEPMNYIDVFSRQSIEEAILACTPTMLFVEHDSTFVERIATEVVSL